MKQDSDELKPLIIKRLDGVVSINKYSTCTPVHKLSGE